MSAVGLGLGHPDPGSGGGVGPEARVRQEERERPAEWARPEKAVSEEGAWPWERVGLLAEEAKSEFGSAQGL